MSYATDKTTVDMESQLAKLDIKPIIGDQFLVMHEEEIATLERQLRVQLPEAYRKFLAKYGAAAFGHWVMFRSAQSLPPHLSTTGEEHISFFYGPTSDVYGRTYSLAEVNHALKDRMPETLIAIGGETSGNQICLGIWGAETGKVYYWDHENEWDEEDYLEQGVPVPPDMKFQNVHLIADSFEDFIARLFIADD